MSFELKKYIKPDFSLNEFKNAPDAVLRPVLKDGVAPTAFMQ